MEALLLAPVTSTTTTGVEQKEDEKKKEEEERQKEKEEERRREEEERKREEEERRRREEEERRREEERKKAEEIKMQEKKEEKPAEEQNTEWIVWMERAIQAEKHLQDLMNAAEDDRLRMEAKLEESNMRAMKFENDVGKLLEEVKAEKEEMQAAHQREIVALSKSCCLCCFIFVYLC